MAVTVGDEGPGKAEYPRITGEWSLSQFRQLAVIAGGQVIPNLADLLLDEVIIVEQPFGSRNHASAALQLQGARAIDCKQHRGIVVESGVQGQDNWRSRRHRLRGSEAFRVLLKPLDAKKLLPHRRLVVPWRRRRAMPESTAKDRVHERLRSASASATSSLRRGS